MRQQPRLLIPALGALYGTLAPVTEPLIRAVAGGSLAIHGYPILFGNIAAAAKFLASVVLYFTVQGGPWSRDALIGREL